jgi:hypothetical protein
MAERLRPRHHVRLVSPRHWLLLDRFPPRRIILPTILLFALSLATVGPLTPHYRSGLSHMLVLGLVANATAPFTYTRTTLTSFTTRRGTALALLWYQIRSDSAADGIEDPVSGMARRGPCQFGCFSKISLAHPGRKGSGPVSVKRHVRDYLGGFHLSEAVIHCPVYVVHDLSNMARSSQGTDSHETPAKWCKRGTQSEIAKQHMCKRVACRRPPRRELSWIRPLATGDQRSAGTARYRRYLNRERRVGSGIPLSKRFP